MEQKGANSAFQCLTPTKRKKKLILPPSVPHHRICGDPEGNNFKAGVRGPSIRESFDGRRTPAFRFLTRSLVDWVKNLNAGSRFFESFFRLLEFFTHLLSPENHQKYEDGIFLLFFPKRKGSPHPPKKSKRKWPLKPFS